VDEEGAGRFVFQERFGGAARRRSPIPRSEKRNANAHAHPKTQKPKTPTKQMCDYNVPGGKLNRGMAVADVLGALKASDGKPTSLFPADALDANVVGWCIEFLQAFFLVADDIMDGSVTRRGQPCWFRRPEVGMVACNDYILLECALYRCLALHFGGRDVGVSGSGEEEGDGNGAAAADGSNGAASPSRRTEAHPAYGDIVSLFHDVTYQTAHGQLLDLLTAGEAGVQHHDAAGVAAGDAPKDAADRIDLSRYTMQAYTRIVTYKTAFYTIYMPVAAGMLLAGVPKSGGAYALARRLCVEMGRYFQAQDDYLDLYGDPAVIGKVGTDIEDGKCCWLVCKALELASAEQRETIARHYGRKGEEHTSAIKAVYQELGMEARFREYEQQSHEKLVAEVDGQELLPKEVFHALLRKIYKRNK
jgi:farnesyl diphosphate synthase